MRAEERQPGKWFERLVTAIDYMKWPAVGWSGVCILGILLIVISEVFARYVFRLAFEWSLDLSVLLFVLLSFLGLGYTELVKGHVTVDIITVHFSERTQTLLDIIFIAPSLVVCIIMIWKGLVVASMAYAGHWLTESIVIPDLPRYLALPVGFLLFALQLFSSLYKNVRKLKGQAASHEVSAAHPETPVRTT